MITAPIRIILVDDHKVVRTSWKMLIENNPQFNVIAECDNGHSALEEAGLLQPDIMLVDINMSPLNGFDVTTRVVAAFPAIKVIGISVNNYPKYAEKLVQLGAKGFITKTSSLEEIQHGIMEVFNGRIYICDEIKRTDPPTEETGSF
jgi:two-component system, NarL family, invasion response regulator UvrY